MSEGTPLVPEEHLKEVPDPGHGARQISTVSNAGWSFRNHIRPQHAPRHVTRLLNQRDSGERDGTHGRQQVGVCQIVSRRLWVAWMRQSEVWGVAPDGRGTKHVLPQRLEGLLPSDAGQEDTVFVKYLRPAETKGYARRPGVDKSSREQIAAHEGKLVFPAERHMRRNETALDRVKQPTHRLQFPGRRLWHKHAQLNSCSHAAIAVPGDASRSASASARIAVCCRPTSCVLLIDTSVWCLINQCPQPGGKLVRRFHVRVGPIQRCRPTGFVQLPDFHQHLREPPRLVA